MSVASSFATYLASTVGSTIGQDLFIGLAPSSQQATDSLWWIVPSGGQKEIKLPTGEALKRYTIDIYYRNMDYQTVYEELSDLEETLNLDGCTQLSGYETVDVEAFIFSIDQDLDAEERKIGLLQVNITLFKE